MENHKLIIAESYLCVPAVLESIIYNLTNRKILQESIAELLGVHVPLNYNGQIKNVIHTCDSNKWGVDLSKNNINKIFIEFNLELSVELVPISTLNDMTFQSTLKKHLQHKRGVFCGYNYGILFHNTDVNSGHASIITDIKDNSVLLIDPGPHEYGLKYVNELDLYWAIRDKDDGIWVISTIN